MDIPADLFYTEEHEWVKIKGDKATIGITDYAQDSLGDITYVELPKIDEGIEQFKPFSTVESVKAASDIYAPLSGKVVEINDELRDSPQLINQSPHDKAWFVVIEIKDINEKDNLMTAEDYKKYLGKLN